MSEEPKYLTATEILRRQEESSEQFSEWLRILLRHANENGILIYTDFTKREPEIRAISQKQVDCLIKTISRLLQVPEMDKE